MGTSNLYKGPKGSALLPADYNGSPDDLPETTPSTVEPSNDEKPELEGQEGRDEQNGTEQNESSKVKWKDAKSYFTRQIGKRLPDVRGIAKIYTKASGGYKHASKASFSSKRVVRRIISLFSGSPNDIRQRIEQWGIVFEGRSTKDVFNDIYPHLCTGSVIREDAVADKALAQTFSELFESDLFEDQGLDLFKPELLEYLVSHFVTNSIFYKLLNEVAFGELTSDKPNEDVARIEDDLKTFIDGIVRGRVTEHLHSGISRNEINKLVDNLYEDCYKVMEGLSE